MYKQNSRHILTQIKQNIYLVLFNQLRCRLQKLHQAGGRLPSNFNVVLLNRHVNYCSEHTLL